MHWISGNDYRIPSLSKGCLTVKGIILGRWSIGKLWYKWIAQVVFEVVAGTVSEGYVAIDEVHFDNNEECKTVPDFANPMTTSNKPGAIIGIILIQFFLYQNFKFKLRHKRSSVFCYLLIKCLKFSVGQQTKFYHGKRIFD